MVARSRSERHGPAIDESLGSLSIRGRRRTEPRLLDRRHRSLKMTQAWMSLSYWGKNPSNLPEDGQERPERTPESDWRAARLGRFMPDLGRIEAGTLSLSPSLQAVWPVEDALETRLETDWHQHLWITDSSGAPLLRNRP